MRHTRSIVLFGLAIGLAFAAGAVTAVKREWGTPLVIVTAENNASEPVVAVEISYSSCGHTSTLQTKNLGADQRQKFKLIVCGEGGYKLKATMANGKILESGGYVENGYKAVEHIEPSRIRSESTTYSP